MPKDDIFSSKGSTFQNLVWLAQLMDPDPTDTCGVSAESCSDSYETVSFPFLGKRHYMCKRHYHTFGINRTSFNIHYNRINFEAEYRFISVFKLT